MPEIEKFLFILVAGVACLLLAVVVVRFFLALKTRRWSATEGRVISVGVRTEKDTHSDATGGNAVRTVPDVVYEYTVSGKTHRGQSVKLALQMTQADTPRMLSQYAAGQSVTVYFNPEDPREAVLEREPLRLSAERMGCLAVVAGVPVLALVFGMKPLYGLVARLFPHADNVDVLILSTGMGVFLFAFGLVWLRDSLKEARWPSVTGTVASSNVESFRTQSAGSAGHRVMVTMYRPKIVYRYVIDGRSYESSQIQREQACGSEALAQGIVSKYPKGSSILVRYNPANPTDAVLKTKLRSFVVLWGLGVAMLLVALHVSGVFH